MTEPTGMTPNEQAGYEVLLRVAQALEGIQDQLTQMNKEGIVIFGGQTMEEN